MNRFYIEKLSVTGGKHAPTTINFNRGLNFILGPSNTGKSLVMECLDYMFGFIPKKRKPSKIVDNNYGYETITLDLVTNKGKVILERKIGDNEIKVSSNDPTIDSGTYKVSHTSKKSINNVYLQLLGIDEEHYVRSSKKGGKTQALTWRSMLHLFFIKQGDVSRESSPLLAPGSVGDTASAAVLLYLLTGKDANDLAAEEDPKISEAKRKALINYIGKKVEALSIRRKELEESIASSNIPDPHESIGHIKNEIKELQTQLNNATKESQSIMSQIYSWNDKLVESQTIAHNFSILRQQYKSDINRIEFIVHGAVENNTVKEKIICPICGEETEKIQTTDFIESSAAELEKIKHHLLELSEAQQSIESQIESIIAKIHELEEKKSAVDTLINEQIKPKLAVFEDELDQNLKLVRLSSELEIVRKDETQYKSELFTKETEETPEQKTYNIYDDYEQQIVFEFEEKLKSILIDSKIDGAATARLNMDIFDVEIDGKNKSVSMGGGFCGILNTITTLAITSYLTEHDRNVPGFYAVDSSLTQLSEAEHKDQSDTIKQNFINYLINHANERQVIIVEQYKRMPFIPESMSNVNVIQFTRNKDVGRYGFLNDVYNPDDK